MATLETMKGGSIGKGIVIALDNRIYCFVLLGVWAAKGRR